MPSFTGLLIVTAVAFGAPFLLGLFPVCRLPGVVLEIVAGIVVGPSVLGWVQVDETIAVVATLGLAFLLFLAGLEIDFARLRGRVLRLDRARLRGVVRDRGRRRGRAAGGGARRRAAAGGDHALGDVARRADPGAQGRRARAARRSGSS